MDTPYKHPLYYFYVCMHPLNISTYYLSNFYRFFYNIFYFIDF